jgi:hypothetical protein
MLQCFKDLDEKINTLLRQLGEPEVVFDATKDDFYHNFQKYNYYKDLREELTNRGLDPDTVLQYAKDAKALWDEPTQQLSNTGQEDLHCGRQQISDPQWLAIEDEEYTTYCLWQQDAPILERCEWAKQAY